MPLCCVAGLPDAVTDGSDANLTVTVAVPVVQGTARWSGALWGSD